MNTKERYEQPLLVHHDKLTDITGSFGSGKGKETTESSGTSKSWKEGKEWYKEGKDGW